MGLGESIDAALLLTWVISNIVLTITFSAIGGLLMFLFLLNKQKKENAHHSQKVKKSDSRWIDRLISSVVLVFYLSTFVVPAALPVAAASPDCSKKKLTPEEFIGCYDPDKEYQPHSEAIVPEPKRRIPLDGGTGGDSNGNKGSSLEEYYSKYPGIPPEQINELYEMCQTTAGCNFEELLEEYENEVLTLPVYENGTPEDPNLLLATLEGLGGAGQDTWNFITTEGGKGLNYLKENWNNPKKMLDDAGNTIGEFRQAYEEGQRERLGQKGNDAKGVADWFGKKFQQYNSDFGGQLKKDLGWMDKNILQPYLKHGADTTAYLQKNPQDQWMMNNFLFAPYLHGKVFVESNYNGGIKQFKQDAAVALSDKNTYWNILKSPFSKRTQQLAAEGKLAQAMGRGAGEMSIEAGQEIGETLATGGIGKVGMVVVGFTVDASKVARRTENLSESIMLAARFQNDKGPIDVKTYERLQKAYKAEQTIFRTKKVEHVLAGETYPDGNVGGFHHKKSAKDGNTYVIEGTEQIVDDRGFYKAQVVIDGTPKWTESTFFPDDWDDVDVILAIEDAYKVKRPDPLGGANAFIGTTSDGIEIKIIVDNAGKIRTAYPNY